MLTVGNKVIYPCQGLCRVGAVVKKVVDGRPVRCYRLDLLDEHGGELFVPVNKAQAIGVRLLLKRSEVPRLLDRLKQAAGAAKDWKQRARDNLKLFISGSAFDLAQVVESLTELSETKALSAGEKWTLERARKLLIGEISEVMGGTTDAAEGQVDQALKARMYPPPLGLPKQLVSMGNPRRL